MFEREDEKVVDDLEYDDCDVTVPDKSLTIDEQMRKIGFQSLKKALGQATKAGAEVEAADDEDGGGEEQAAVDNEGASPGDPTTPKSPRTPSSSSAAEAGTPTSPSAAPTSAAAPATPGGGRSQEEDSSDYQTVMRLLEEGEKITHMYRCARVQGLDAAEGNFIYNNIYQYITGS